MDGVSRAAALSTRGSFVHGLMLFIFVLLPLTGAGLALRVWLLLRRGVRVRARIVGFETLDARGGSEPEAVRFPVVEFRDARGKLFRFALSSSFPHQGEPAVGDTLHLVHPASRPRRATYANARAHWLPPLLCFVPALTLLLYLALALLW